MKKTGYVISYEVMMDGDPSMKDMDEEFVRVNIHLSDRKYDFKYSSRSNEHVNKTENGFRMVVRVDEEYLVCRAMRWLTHRIDVTNVTVDY